MRDLIKTYWGTNNTPPHTHTHSFDILSKCEHYPYNPSNLVLYRFPWKKSVHMDNTYMCCRSSNMQCLVLLHKNPHGFEINNIQPESIIKDCFVWVYLECLETNGAQQIQTDLLMTNA